MQTPQLKLKTDAQLISNNVPTSRILEIELTAPTASRERESTPLNLALVIDRSGSMGGGKLEQAKVAVRQILELLRPCDGVSIVDFDNIVTIDAEVSSVTPGARDEIMAGVKRLHARGSTDLGEGWLRGCESVARRLSDGRVNRTLLLTDGQANQGMTDPEELSRHAAALFERGVATSTFGIGLDFNEHLLEAMANNGGGNYYYIERDQCIPELLMAEFKDLAAVTLKNVVLEFHFPANVSVELLGDWRSEKDDNKLVINLSDLPADRTINLFIKILTPPGSGQLVMNATASGRDEDDKPFHVAQDVTLQYATPDKVAEAEAARDTDLVTRFSTVVVGHYANQSYKLEREGKYEEAGRLMDRLMAEHGIHLPRSTRERYDRISGEVREGLDESRRKLYTSDSYNLKRFKHDEQRKDPDQK